MLWKRIQHRQLVIFACVLCLIPKNGTCTPISLFSAASTASFAFQMKNVKCISRITGESGICMFARSCAKSKGTHIGICAQGFMFGSCCKIEELIDPPSHDIFHTNEIPGNVDRVQEFEEQLQTTLPPEITNYDTNTEPPASSTILQLEKTSSSAIGQTTLRPAVVTTYSASTVEQSVTEPTTEMTTPKNVESETTIVPDTPTTSFGEVELNFKTTMAPSDSETTFFAEEPQNHTTTMPTTLNSQFFDNEAIQNQTIKTPTSTTESTITTARLTTTQIPETTLRYQQTTETKAAETPQLILSTPVSNGMTQTTEAPTLTSENPKTTVTTPNIPMTSSSTTTWTEETKTSQSTTEAFLTSGSGNTTHTTKAPPLTSEFPKTTVNVTTPKIPVTTPAKVTIDKTLTLSGSAAEVCGRRMFPEPRIVGGNSSIFGKWPWQISLRIWSQTTFRHKCGAALLNEKWAITAAHCVLGAAPNDILLRFGEYDLNDEDPPHGFKERRVSIVVTHPYFDQRTFEYDLTLLRLSKPMLPFQPNILPVCVPDDDDTYVGETAFVTGWGRLFEYGPTPSKLQEVAVPILDNSACERMYRTAGIPEEIPQIFICAGYRHGGSDSCEGDSGGPLVIQRKRDQRWILIGIISWGIGCAEPNQPGVYTRISEFRGWINQILQY